MSKNKVFLEKEIRRQILIKVQPKNINKDGKHWMGDILVNEKFIGKIKIPNEHRKEMYINKTKHIAKSLMISIDEFAKLIECSLSGDEYYKLLEDKNGG
jgi:hypothetical protein